jgi:hypothetical protein
VDQQTLSAFEDELEKIAFLGGLWQKFLDIFRSGDSKARRRSDYHFSDQAGSDKWNKFTQNVGDKKFVDYVKAHPDSDPTLALHAQSMHDLSKGEVQGKIMSSRLPGRSYEIRTLPGGSLGCTCADWRFKGSVNPGYECKHVRAHKQGGTKAD